MPTTVCLVPKTDARRTRRVPTTGGLICRLLGSATVILATIAVGSAFGKPPTCESCVVVPIPKDARKVERNSYGNKGLHTRLYLRRKFPDNRYIWDLDATLGKDWGRCRWSAGSWRASGFAGGPHLDDGEIHWSIGASWYNPKTHRSLIANMEYVWQVDRHGRVHHDRVQQVDAWEESAPEVERQAWENCVKGVPTDGQWGF